MNELKKWWKKIKPFFKYTIIIATVNQTYTVSHRLGRLPIVKPEHTKGLRGRKFEMIWHDEASMLTDEQLKDLNVIAGNIKND